MNVLKKCIIVMMMLMIMLVVTPVYDATVYKDISTEECTIEYCYTCLGNCQERCEVRSHCVLLCLAENCRCCLSPSPTSA